MADEVPVPTTEAELQALMSDPRYWRDRDPVFGRRFSEGARLVYPPTEPPVYGL